LSFYLRETYRICNFLANCCDCTRTQYKAPISLSPEVYATSSKTGSRIRILYLLTGPILRSTRDGRYSRYPRYTAGAVPKYHGTSTANIAVHYGTNFIVLTTALAGKAMQLVCSSVRPSTLSFKVLNQHDLDFCTYRPTVMPIAPRAFKIGK